MFKTTLIAADTARSSSLKQNTMALTQILVNWLERRYVKKLDGYLTRAWMAYIAWSMLARNKQVGPYV